MIPTEAIKLAHRPPGEGSYLYFLMRGEVCVYVGQTTNLRNRLGGHGDKNYDSVRYVEVDAECRLAEEQRFIQILSPEFNGTPGRKVRTDAYRAVNIHLAEAAVERADELAAQHGVSRSQAIEIALLGKRRVAELRATSSPTRPPAGS